MQVGTTTAPRRGPTRHARPSKPLAEDAEGLDAKDLDCSCDRVKNGGRACRNPSVCEHLQAGVACTHPSPFQRQLEALQSFVLGALPGVRSARSEVRDGGSGVVSAREFLPGTPLMLYTGHITSTKPRSNVYVMALPASIQKSRPQWLIGDPNTCLATRANHSCNPNMDVAKLRTYCGSSEPLVVFYAKRRIRGLRDKPVNVTLSYDFDDAEKMKAPCACGSRQCCGLFGCNPQLCATRRDAQAQFIADRSETESGSASVMSETAPGSSPVQRKQKRRRTHSRG